MILIALPVTIRCLHRQVNIDTIFARNRFSAQLPVSESVQFPAAHLMISKGTQNCHRTGVGNRCPRKLWCTDQYCSHTFLFILAQHFVQKQLDENNAKETMLFTCTAQTWIRMWPSTCATQPKAICFERHLWLTAEKRSPLLRITHCLKNGV